jgi:hypothetical protein
MDVRAQRTHDWAMTVSPLPQHGDVVVGRDVAGRTLRVSGHPESGRGVLSIWQDTVCRATVRLAPEDVPDVVAMLARTALRTEGDERPQGLGAG